MIRLTYSNNTELLIDHLAQSIKLERQIKTLWEPIQLLVPNSTIKKYIRVQLAQRLGIAANIRFSYPENIGQELLSVKKYHIITKELLNAALLMLFDNNDNLVEDCLAPVRNYLSEDSTGLKLVQLASQLSDLYDDYDLNRPRWIRAWRKNQPIQTQNNATEAWQRLIWMKIMKSIDKTGLHYLTMSEVATISIDNINNLSLDLHAFGFTYLAQTYYQIFTKLGELGNLHLYNINPCQEFWEDLTVDNKNIKQATKNYNEGKNDKIRTLNGYSGNIQENYWSPSNEPEILRSWGQAGRKNIISLNNISQYNFETCFKLPKSKALLGKIQKDILLFQNSSKDKEPNLDTNIHFWACPNQRRETEIVATEIWHLLELHAETNQPLRFSDIAVLLPQNEKQSYMANIQAAFKEANDIPWARRAAKPSSLIDIIEAAKLLINLPASEFTRIDIIRIITNPNIANHISKINSKIWGKVFYSLNIIYGIDAHNWTDADTDKNIKTQNQESKCSTQYPQVENDIEFQNEYYNHHSSTEPYSICHERIIYLIRILLDFAKQLKHEYQEPKKWSVILKRFLSTWLLADNEATILAIEKIFNSLRKTLESAPSELPSPKLSYAAIRFLVIESLTKLYNQQPCELTEGVVVSDVGQICSIPFRTVFILGLNESAVLYKENHSALNLRLKEHRTVDITQSDKEHYSFTEILTLTQERLYLSYITHNQMTGIALEPSCLFSELIDIVKNYIQTDPIIQHHPLHRFDPLYFSKLFSTEEQTSLGLLNYTTISKSEAKAVWSGNNICQNQTKPLTLISHGNTDLSSLKNKTHSTILHNQKSVIDNRNNYKTVLPIRDLIKWLECPLTGAAAIHLDLCRDPIKSMPSVDDEIFDSNTLDKYNLLREIAIYSSCNNCTPEKSYDIIINNIQYQNYSSLKLLAQINKKSNLALICSWLTLLEGARPEMWHLSSKQLSKNILSNHQALPLPLKVKIKDIEHIINIVGNLRPQLWGGSIFFEIGRPPKSNLEVIQKKALRAYVDQIILSCITNNTVEHRAWFIFSVDKVKDSAIKSITFKPICAYQSLEILNGWIKDIFENNNEILMPIEAVLAAINNNQKITKEHINQYVDSQINSGAAGFSSMHGPVPNLQSYNPPNDIMQIVNNRFANFIKQVQVFDDLN